MLIFLKYSIVTMAICVLLPIAAEAEAEEETKQGGEETKEGGEAPRAAEPSAGPPPLAPENPPKPPPAPDTQATLEAIVEPSATSKAMANKLFVGTGMGWVKASKSKGKWNSAGMSDFSVGYKVPMKIMKGMTTFGTFRFAPMAITAEIDENNYRGVIEMYNFGAMGLYKAKKDMFYVGSCELGYGMVHLTSLNTSEENSSHAAGGVMLSLGGGADWIFAEKISIGPRVHLGFGSVTAMQLGAATRFVF